MQRSQVPSLHQSTPCSSPLRRRHAPLATQAALPLLLLSRVSHVAAHRLLHLNHKAIEDMDKRLCQLREAWVVEREKSIRFGTGQKWLDMEADVRPPLTRRWSTSNCNGSSGAAWYNGEA